MGTSGSLLMDVSSDLQVVLERVMKCDEVCVHAKCLECCDCAVRIGDVLSMALVDPRFGGISVFVNLN
jgi:hypothetical protein